MTYGLSRASEAGPVWLALSETGPAYLEAAQALRAELEHTHPAKIEWRTGHWSEFEKSAAEPRAVVAIGTAAQRGMQELFANAITPPPLLVVLVPRLVFERHADPIRLRAGTMSAVFLDQHPARQIELIRQALPKARRIGVLVGTDWKDHTAGLAGAAKERGMELVISRVESAGIFTALQSLLADVDVLLALPDPEIFNGQTAGNILTAAYRRQVPLIGFSPAYVKAGALLALYSTPSQIGTRGGELLRQALAGKPWPPPQWPQEFSVRINQDVARSLGLALDEQRLHEQLRRMVRP
ncbi:MAG: hypothetical protein K9K30_02045 [Burkholderiaceae bacterium]|nr:hypothetical protein [Burkholderiaceae bacterium]MCF8183447.1 hypothetical protein [Polynucleobacter sp.]